MVGSRGGWVGAGGIIRVLGVKGPKGSREQR